MSLLKQLFVPGPAAPSKGYAQFNAFMVIYVLLVILWGAWVRISHSGDGCGDSWPLCNGVFLPEEGGPGKTWVEYSHRLQSGLFGILILVTVFWGRKVFPKGHVLRFWAMATLFFTITEALLGATLVKAGYVGTNDSYGRALVMGLHFSNSVLLVVSCVLVALFSRSMTWIRREKNDPIFSLRMQRRVPTVAFVIFAMLGITGSIAALSTTLFPTTSLLEGFKAEFEEGSHFLMRLRTMHPTLGVFAGVGLTLLFYFAAEISPENEKEFRRRSWFVILTIATTVILGSVTLLWLSPVPLKLVHLFLAHLLGITLTAWWQSLRYKLN